MMVSEDIPESSLCAKKEETFEAARECKDSISGATVENENPETLNETATLTMSTPQASNQDSQSFDFGLKKKKKKTPVAPVLKDIPKVVDGESKSSTTSINRHTEQISKTQELGKQTDEGIIDAEQAIDSQLKTAFKEKKKKRNKTHLADFESRLRAEEDNKDYPGPSAETASLQSSKVETGWAASDRDYTYEELLERIFKILHQNNLELAGEKKYTIAPPQVTREGTKKSVFSNLVDICKAQPDHVIQYLFSELGTTGSIDSSQRLVIKGRFQQKQIESVLKRYFVDYVSCKTCKSADTILTKENRLFFVQCESCGSSRSVSAIKTGFMAQTQKRSAQRAAAGS